MKHRALIDRMTLRDKIALCSGADFFSTKTFQAYGIPSIAMVDGPHGLRKQLATADQLGINESVPSTCFPTASLCACSWDRALLRELGTAIAEEALQEGVSIVLGPGVNIKRNPLCGRNFEYFSEDPYLAGEMATNWIKGLQRQGVGASLKHLAGNNQENERMTSDSLIDERTLREIYLPAFEKAVKQAEPATVMCAYNKLNGTYCSDHRYLLREILREEWGFDGVILTDWGAMHDRVEAFEAGLDLEMPNSNGYFDEMVIAAIGDGALSEERLNESVDRLLDMVFTAAARRQADYRYSVDDHHLLAKNIATNSAVLLKNEANALPISEGKRIALIGALAKEPRYQGSGSSHITPTQLSNVIDGFNALKLDYVYYPGYTLDGTIDDMLLPEAVAGAQKSDIAVIVAGLPDIYESEGFDRTSLAMPDAHNKLIGQVAEANPNTVVVLVGGAPVEMPWLSKVRAVLNMYLSGQAGGLAAAELLAGGINPSGKLAESYPMCYADVPNARFYETGGRQAQYREGVYVGYRYYDKAEIPVLFPFGHGLSYTSFEYQDLVISTVELDPPYELTVSAKIRNTGDRDGAEVVQLYVGNPQQPTYRPEKELREFTKIFLKAGETREVSFTLDARAFAVYDAEVGKWEVPGGAYTILIGASSRDIRLQRRVNVHGSPVSSRLQEVPRWYLDPTGEVTQADFESLLGRRIEPVKPAKKGEYTLDCSFQDMKNSFVIRQIVKGIERSIGKSFGGVDYGNPTFKLIMASSTSTPLRKLSQLEPNSMPIHITTGMVHLANGRYLAGVLSMLNRRRRP
ncbi:MAG: glycoside hydrolase family 3 C-terminal domain-containing protein [Anaerolineae bacterium]